VIADLTDEKQNVYCEVGYAKARGIPFFLTFQRKAGSGKEKTTAPANAVGAELELLP
jgi:nucleoside 2-deoxyribosyltransferase